MRRADHEDLVGRHIAGKYVVESLIGTGAMGAVFRARQIALEKTVAIKVMRGEHADDPAFVARFHQEAKAASRLNHPNSIQILDFGAEPDGLLYIAMEYLDGRSLHEILQAEWPLAPTRIADLLMQTLAALAIAHDLGVVHRDLKPENVMVLRGTDDDGRAKDVVKVCDFGIAKITDPRAYRGSEEGEPEAPVTTAGFLVGTPEYMSPEQGRGEPLDPRSDLYSVGVILFEMLTRRVPFDAENAIGIVLKHITDEPALPSRITPGCDARLEAIALRALKKVRGERYSTAREMRAELRLVGGSVPVAAAGVADPAAEAASGAEAPAPAERSPSGPGATVVMPRQSASSGAKPTLHGTTASVSRRPSPRRSLVLGGAILVALVAAVSGKKLVGGHAAATSAASNAMSAVDPAAATAPATTENPPEPAGNAASAAPEPAAGREAAPGAHDTPHVRSASGASPSHGAALAGASAASAATSKAAARVDSGVVAPAASPSASAASVMLATPPPANGEASEPAPDPAFDPAQAYVEVGMINAERVQERALRSALHGVALAQCYRSALRARGGRATGIATLNLSFDEGGLARTAIVTGADFLPGLGRCVQDASTGLRVASSQVEQGGGVAEVTLSFQQP